MTLDDWLKQDRNLADQLKVIEGLCSALNEAHESGNVDADVSVETAQIFGKSLPFPVDRRAEHLDRHRFDANETI